MRDLISSNLLLSIILLSGTQGLLTDGLHFAAGHTETHKTTTGSTYARYTRQHTRATSRCQNQRTALEFLNFVAYLISASRHVILTPGVLEQILHFTLRALPKLDVRWAVPLQILHLISCIQNHAESRRKIVPRTHGVNGTSYIQPKQATG